MRSNRWLCVAVAFQLHACCAHRVSLRDFERSSLPSQIEQYEQAASHGCLREEKLSLLDQIAEHGCESADAMDVVLNDPASGFPADDAITVVRFVRASGCDVRQRNVVATLRRIAASSGDQVARRSAARLLDDLEAK